jgi:membrane protein implicated in regulation of membrane protease activity
MGNQERSPAVRRLRFATVVLISQVLLIALAIAWAVHMALIAAEGSVYFIEGNPFVLWLEIALTLSICIFGVAVFIMQIRRLGERRTSDRSGQGRRM